ncbi:MAG: carboxypeptidase regulatory-like domain-containing protein [Bryobacteraceae bacterium]
MKLGALLLFSALVASAQTTYEIRGNVSEPGLGGIAGAEVRATAQNNPSPTEYLSTFTNGRGDFVIPTSKPGSYTIVGSREGYGPSMREGPAFVIVDAEHPTTSVRLSMLRPAEIVGRVLDAETLEPVEGMTISIVQKRVGSSSEWTGAYLISRFAGPADLTSKKDGSFSIKGLMPGEYSAMATRMDPATSPWSADYSPDDLKVVDQQPDTLLWPGGAPKDVAHPIPVGSGAVVSFGDILLKKVPHYRAHVSLEQGSCPPGESLRVSVFPSPRTNANPLAFPCGSELLLRDLRPGTYSLYGVSDWQGERENVENAAWATAQFTVVDKGVEVALIPQPGVVLEGQLIAADGFKNMPSLFSFGVQPVAVDGVRPPPEQFIESLADGRFRIAVSNRSQTLMWRNADVYIKQIRYNGSPIVDLTLTPNPGSSAHRLEMVLDDKFGALTGTVTSSGNPVARSVVLLWAENMVEPMIIDVVNGVIQSRNLAPGEYRASTERPEDLLGAFTGASEKVKTGERVTIRAGETTTLNMKLSATAR